MCLHHAGGFDGVQESLNSLMQRASGEPRGVVPEAAAPGCGVSRPNPQEVPGKPSGVPEGVDAFSAGQNLLEGLSEGVCCSST